MEVFLDAFFAIDKANHEKISRSDLLRYMEENNLEESFPKKWMDVFHAQRSGIITLDSYCETLGLIPRKARAYRVRKESFLVESSRKPVESARSHSPLTQQRNYSGFESSSYRNSQMNRRDPNLPSDVEVIQEDMPLDMKIKIIDFVRKPLDEMRAQGSTANLRFEPITNDLKKYLDKVDGPLWHVTILVGQFATHFSYSPGCMFHFKIGRFIVLAWKTPQL